MPKNSGPRTLLKQIDLRNALKQSMFTGKMYIYIIQQYTVVHHLLCNTNQTVFSKGKVSGDFASPFVWKVVSIAWIYSDSQMSMIVRSLQYFFYLSIRLKVTRTITQNWLDSVVSYCNWHRLLSPWLVGVGDCFVLNSFVESDSFVTMTLLSLTPLWQWHRWVWLLCDIDTVESDSLVSRKRLSLLCGFSYSVESDSPVCIHPMEYDS